MRENCSVIVCSYDYQCSENQNIFWIGPHSCTYVIAIKENNKNLCSFVRFPRYRRQQRQMETKHHGHVTNQFRQILLSICLLVSAFKAMSLSDVIRTRRPQRRDLSGTNRSELEMNTLKRSSC